MPFFEVNEIAVEFAHFKMRHQNLVMLLQRREITEQFFYSALSDMGYRAHEIRQEIFDAKFEKALDADLNSRYTKNANAENKPQNA